MVKEKKYTQRIHHLVCYYFKYNLRASHTKVKNAFIKSFCPGGAFQDCGKRCFFRGYEILIRLLYWLSLSIAQPQVCGFNCGLCAILNQEASHSMQQNRLQLQTPVGLVRNKTIELLDEALFENWRGGRLKLHIDDCIKTGFLNSSLC